MGFVQPYTCPCKDCKSRELACHGKCSKYQKWKVWRNGELKKEKQQRQYTSWLYK